MVSIENKYGETPLDKCQPALKKKLHERAAEMGQDLRKREFKDLSWLGLKTRSRGMCIVLPISNKYNYLD